jgi:tRNA1(Val) A37 N6-methylase TrmN6
VELDEKAHLAALENIRRNGLEHRLHSICADLRTVNRLFEPGSFQCCVSNPPYFTGGAASRTPLARRDDCCSTEQLFEAAARTLCYGGDFYLVHKPERLAQLCGCAVKAGLEPKRLKLVRHRTDGPVALVLLQCRKGAKPGLVWEELALYHRDGSPTEEYQRIYHLQEEQL